jgi:hypothetical protein
LGIYLDKDHIFITDKAVVVTLFIEGRLYSREKPGYAIVGAVGIFLKKDDRAFPSRGW